MFLQEHRIIPETVDCRHDVSICADLTFVHVVVVPGLAASAIGCVRCFWMIVARAMPCGACRWFWMLGQELDNNVHRFASIDCYVVSNLSAMRGGPLDAVRVVCVYECVEDREVGWVGRVDLYKFRLC